MNGNDRAQGRGAAKAAAAGLVTMALGAAAVANAAATDDAKTVANLDTRYQLAVKQNDAATMDRILHDDFVLVLGTGEAYSKEHLLKVAREKKYTFELQDEEPGTQSVRVYGDTAIVTAKLIVKAITASGKPFAEKLWFSDTYVRTPQGWRYAFGQASIALPEK